MMELADFPLCLGGNVFGWTADAATSFAILDEFVSAGGRLVDTADSYSHWVPGNNGGESESIIGRWLVASGSEVAVATKVGKQPGRGKLSAENIRRSAEQSLQRLGRDHIDLYYLHQEDPDTELTETLAALDSLVRDGLVAQIGASNLSMDSFRTALAIQDREGYARFTAVQPHYHLLHRAEFESELAALCRDESIAVFAYYALARGYLTGKYRPGSTVSSVRAGAAWGFDDDRGRRVLAVMDRIAAEQGVPVAVVALAWLRHQGATPISSARTPEQLRDLLKVTGFTLRPADGLELNVASKE